MRRWSGYTLTELLVVISGSVVVMGIAFSFMLTSMRWERLLRHRMELHEAVGEMLMRICTDIKRARRVYIASSSQLLLYGNFTTLRPEMRTYTYESKHQVLWQVTDRDGRVSHQRLNSERILVKRAWFELRDSNLLEVGIMAAHASEPYGRRYRLQTQIHLRTSQLRGSNCKGMNRSVRKK